MAIQEGNTIIVGAWRTEDLEAPVVRGRPIAEQVKEVKARQVMPSSVDLDGDGMISIAEARAATNQLKMLRRGFFIVLALLVVQQFMMFGTVYWASQLASEVHVRNAELEDDNGRPVSTLQRRDRIDGLHYSYAAARRLNEAGINASDSGTTTTEPGSTQSDTNEIDTVLTTSNVNESTSGDSGFHGSLEISQSYFQSTWDGYMSGKSDWVVPFPDGSVRTVFIQGMSATYAWGICGACPGGNVQWEAQCPSENDPNECSVEYHEVASSRLRRLQELKDEEAATAVSPLLARARAQRQDMGGDVEMQGMERSLGGKHCA